MEMNMRALPRNQRGFSLLELMVVLGIVAVLMVSYWALKRDDSTSLKNAGVAAALAKVADAADAYAKANATALKAAAGPTTAVTVTVAQLIAGGGHLDPSFAATNAYGQTWRVRFIEPTPGDLQALVDSYGGTAITYDSLAEIAQMAVKDGAPGGLISSTAPFGGVPAGCSGAAVNYARGVFGDWCVMLANFGGSPGDGHVAAAVFYANAAVNDDFLHRTANANPALNAMSTDINMQGNDLNNVKSLNLPAGGNAINIGGSFLYGDSSNLATRSPTGGLYIQTSGGASGNIMQVHNIFGDSSSTFTANDISASDTLYARNAVTTSGDVTASGAMYASNWFRSYGATGWYNQTYGGGFYMADSSWVRSYADKNIYTGGQVQAGTIQSNGTLSAAGRITAGEYVQLNGLANEGWGCSPNGLVGRNAAGTLLSCENGVWTQPGSVSTTIVSASKFGGNGSTASAVCPAGKTVVSGGGSCFGGSYYHWLTASQPQGNGWVVLCSSTFSDTFTTTAYAVCAK